MWYELCNLCFDVTIIREKEEELEREKNLRKDLEQRYKVNVSYWAKELASHKVVICTAFNAARAARFKALVNGDILLRTHYCPVCFLGCANWETFFCGNKMFVNKMRNIFCVPDTKFVSATNVARAGKRENICVGNDVSATMCPRLPGPLESGLSLRYL